MDDIAREAQQIADSYLPVRRALADPGAADQAADAAEVLERGQARPVEYARAYLAQHLDQFLERVARDACRGGRYSELPTKIMAKLLVGFDEGGTTNVFFQRLGVSEPEARVAVDRWQEATALDRDQVADAAARFLRGYLETKPERRPAIMEALGGDSVIAAGTSKV